MVPTTVRLPDDLHAAVMSAASESGVSANVWIVAVISKAVALDWRVMKRPGAEVVEFG